jgi:hypothetical protein
MSYDAMTYFLDSFSDMSEVQDFLTMLESLKNDVQLGDIYIENRLMIAFIPSLLAKFIKKSSPLPRHIQLLYLCFQAGLLSPFWMVQNTNPSFYHYANSPFSYLNTTILSSFLHDYVLDAPYEERTHFENFLNRCLQTNTPVTQTILDDWRKWFINVSFSSSQIPQDRRSMRLPMPDVSEYFLHNC